MTTTAPIISVTGGGEPTPPALSRTSRPGERVVMVLLRLAAFVDYFVGNLPQVTEAALYIPLNEEQMQETETALGQLQ